MSGSALVWFRRDLRVADHAALYHALRRHRPVWCAFVFDTEILDALPARADRRVEFIWRSVEALDAALRSRGGGLIVRHGRAREEIPALARSLGVGAVLVNRDYDPKAIDRDAEVAHRLASLGVTLRDFKDQVIFDRDEVLTGDGRPYSVFTPFKRAWLRKLEPFYVKAYPVERYLGALAPPPRGSRVPSLEAIGFTPTDLEGLGVRAGAEGAEAVLADFERRIDRYHERRDFPAVKGPSYLSVHLRFGTVSIRRLAGLAWSRARETGSAGAETWLGELVWRDFYHMILAHHPRVVDHAFRPEYDDIVWDDRPEWLAAWREGRTGYPIVDAAMRQLNATGYMHNRLRMVAASFLVKDLGIDWRAGEGCFAEKLIDYDLAANNGGWQWAASTGCDAQPYFRIFNPESQSRKFDADGSFIRRYVPELRGCSAKQIHAPWTMSAQEQKAAGVVIGRDYPAPLVDHAKARERTLQRFGRARRA